jgi:hypothetical protein
MPQDLNHQYLSV